MRRERGESERDIGGRGEGQRVYVIQHVAY